MLSKTARRLIWVPIIHTSADLGSVTESVKALYARKVGLKKWDRHVASIDELWRRIREKISRLDLDYSKVKLYQDGLPNCGQELMIVKDMIKAGSLNHRLLLELMEKGARLVGTESPELLIEEYELVRGVLKRAKGARDAGEGRGLSREQARRSMAILRKRDHYIAKRIDGTLERGETGLVFLGLLHRLQGLLPRDIRLSILNPTDSDT